MIDVQVGGSGLVVAHAAHAGTGRAVPVLAEHGLDVVFLLVGQLEAAACEELDAVVGHRVVGGGDHGTHLNVEHAGQERDARGRDDACVDHVESAGGHARRQGGSQKIAGHTHGGIAQIQRQTCGQIPIGQSSNTIGSKHLRHMKFHSLYRVTRTIVVVVLHPRTRLGKKPPRNLLQNRKSAFNSRNGITHKPAYSSCSADE